jgi:hypothetical protein
MASFIAEEQTSWSNTIRVSFYKKVMYCTGKIWNASNWRISDVFQWGLRPRDRSPEQQHGSRKLLNTSPVARRRLAN